MMVSVNEANMRSLREASGASNDNEALSAHAWLALADLCELPVGTPLEHADGCERTGGTDFPTCTLATRRSACAPVASRLAITRLGADARRAKTGIHQGYDATQQVPDAHRGGVFAPGVNGFDFDIMAFMQGRMVWCNNLVEIYKKLYDLDFGGGGPTLALLPELNDIVQIQCSRPDRKTGAPRVQTAWRCS